MATKKKVVEEVKEEVKELPRPIRFKLLSEGVAVSFSDGTVELMTEADAKALHKEGRTLPE